MITATRPDPTRDPWVYRPLPREHASVRLFCFPYAGAGPALFRSWAGRLPPSVELFGVRAPGRERRIREPPHTEWAGLIAAMCTALTPYFDRSVAFFGHSLGASIAYELTRELRRRGKKRPTRLFLSARRSPDSPRLAPTHALPRPEFFARLAAMNGTPAEILNDAHVMTLLEPTLRADVQLAETCPASDGEPVDVPIVAFAGASDEIAPPEYITH